MNFSIVEINNLEMRELLKDSICEIPHIVRDDTDLEEDFSPVRSNAKTGEIFNSSQAMPAMKQCITEHAHFRG